MSGKETQDKLFDRFRDLSQSDDRFMYGIFLSLVILIVSGVVVLMAWQKGV